MKGKFHNVIKEEEPGLHSILTEPKIGIGQRAFLVRTPKGNGLAGEIVPMLDYRGLLDRLRQEATFAGPVPRFSFGPLELDFSRLGTSPVHILTVPQRRLEEVLEARLTELGGTARRGHELTALSQDDDAVTLDLDRSHWMVEEHMPAPVFDASATGLPHLPGAQPWIAEFADE